MIVRMMLVGVVAMVFGCGTGCAGRAAQCTGSNSAGFPPPEAEADPYWCYHFGGDYDAPVMEGQPPPCPPRPGPDAGSPTATVAGPTPP